MQKSENVKKILIAGSHGATTSMSIIEEIKIAKKPWQIYFLGNKWAAEDKKSYSLEFLTIPKKGAEFLEVEPGKIENKFTKFTFPALFKIPYEFYQVFRHVFKIRPSLIISLGGAAGAITALWGWIFRIPVIIHEPTATAGRANLLSKSFASIIAISRQTSERYYPKSKIILTGLPIARYITKNKEDESLRNSKKTILITGGSRGSQWINDAVFEILPSLTARYNVIHQTGVGEFQKFKVLKYSNYKPVSQVSHEEMIRFMKLSDVVVGRAGANTVAELIALKKPAIFIPIPWSHLNEQYENAKYMEKLSAAKILTQENLNPKSLKASLEEILNNYETYLTSANNMKSPDLEASNNILKLVERILNEIK